MWQGDQCKFPGFRMKVLHPGALRARHTVVLGDPRMCECASVRKCALVA